MATLPPGIVGTPGSNRFSKITKATGAVRLILVQSRRSNGRREEWSGLSESNRHLNLGKVPYYHYTKAAQTQLFITRLHENQQANLFTLSLRISCSRNSMRLAKPVPISPRETAAGGRRIVPPCPCPCRRARTSHRLRNTRSPKNDGGASACLY